MHDEGGGSKLESLCYYCMKPGFFSCLVKLTLLLRGLEYIYVYVESCLISLIPESRPRNNRIMFVILFILSLYKGNGSFYP